MTQRIAVETMTFIEITDLFRRSLAGVVQVTDILFDGVEELAFQFKDVENRLFEIVLKMIGKKRSAS